MSNQKSDITAILNNNKYSNNVRKRDDISYIANHDQRGQVTFQLL